MGSITKLMVCVAAAAVVVGPAHAADMFLKLGPVKGDDAAARKGKERSVEVLSWQFGTARKGWDGSIKGGSASTKKDVAPGTHIGSANIVGHGRTAADHEITSPLDASAGLPTGKRATDWTPVTTPVDRGSVRVSVKFPWLDCRVGDRITDATLISSTERVTFNDISVSRCAADEVDLDYALVIVRAWDPALKQE